MIYVRERKIWPPPISIDMWWQPISTKKWRRSWRVIWFRIGGGFVETWEDTMFTLPSLLPYFFCWLGLSNRYSWLFLDMICRASIFVNVLLFEPSSILSPIKIRVRKSTVTSPTICRSKASSESTKRLIWSLNLLDLAYISRKSAPSLGVLLETLVALLEHSL